MLVRNCRGRHRDVLEQPAVLAAENSRRRHHRAPDHLHTAEVLDEFNITDPRVRSVFLNSAIERRGLTLPPLNDDGTRAIETQGNCCASTFPRAWRWAGRPCSGCLKDANAELADVRYLCCVTSTAFVTPGFSAIAHQGAGHRPALLPARRGRHGAATRA